MNPTLFLRSRTALWRRVIVLTLLVLAGCTTEVDLHTGLSDPEANQVVASLRDDGVNAQKRPGKTGVTVTVPEGDLARATAVLTAKGLPHRSSARMGEVFKKEGLISSPLEERARYISALSQELEATLGQIDGVVVARVHVVLSEKAGPGEPVQPPSAAVFIKHLPSLDPDVIDFRVRQLVARSIPGMGAQALDRVSAVFVVADRVPERHPEAPDHSAAVWSIVAAVLALALLAGFVLATRKARERRLAQVPAETEPSSSEASALAPSSVVPVPSA
jgi:type III secretion protein J